MKRKSLQIDYIEYDSFDELSPEDRKVLEKAVEAADSAYAPHS
ncbi:MAG: cytidine deaminase, partial [Bacteroidales bacterium]|nr:cytidine deaminase [Bacteroidales bacterium]